MDFWEKMSSFYFSNLEKTGFIFIKKLIFFF